MIDRRRVMTTDDHEYVDLELPSGTLWATMNVGATSETEYGNYYKYGSGAIAGATDTTYYSGTENLLSSSRDTARQVWGGSWHMPTVGQMQELKDNTTYTWEANFNGSGVKGGKFTSEINTSKYIFLPAAGYWYDGRQIDVGSSGYYWSSTHSTDRSAYFLYLRSGDEIIGSGISRSCGLQVRPVIG